MNTAQKVAEVLLEIGSVGFVPDSPISFKSGIKSPVYVDNRKFPFHPAEWNVVIEGFADIIKKNNINFDVIAGVEAAGIPHSAALGFFLKKPSVFVRKQAKDHGTKKMVEGGDVKGKKVLLIEDLVSMGNSSLSAIASLRAEGAIVEDCLVIVSYDFPEAKEAFIKNNVNLHTVTHFPTILEEATKRNILKDTDLKIVKEWFAEHTK